LRGARGAPGAARLELGEVLEIVEGCSLLCRALRRNPPHVVCELVLRGVRAILSRSVDRVRVTAWSASPVLVGEVCLRLSLARMKLSSSSIAYSWMDGWLIAGSPSSPRRLRSARLAWCGLMLSLLESRTGAPVLYRRSTLTRVAAVATRMRNHHRMTGIRPGALRRVRASINQRTRRGRI
jgi:hypothetical protein